MFKKIALILLLTSLISCKKAKESSKIVGIEWLLGKWENKSDNGNLLETWKKVNDSIYEGQSYFIKGNDTLHFEQMQLNQKGEILFYVSTIKGQNNDEPLNFIQNSVIEKQLVFENKKNKYPKKISYTPISKEQLAIEISGQGQGKSVLTRYTLNKSK